MEKETLIKSNTLPIHFAN